MLGRDQEALLQLGAMSQQPARGATPPTSRRPPLLQVDDIGQEFASDDGKPNRVLQDITLRASTGPRPSASWARRAAASRPSCAWSPGMYDRRTPMPTDGQVRIRGRVVHGPARRRADGVPAAGAQGLAERAGATCCCRSASALWGERVAERGAAASASTQMLEAVGLTAAARLYPRQLSGGMQQRVSLAARLVLRPSILCLDEPFSALDPQTRLEMQDLVLAAVARIPLPGAVRHPRRDRGAARRRSHPGAVHAPGDASWPTCRSRRPSRGPTPGCARPSAPELEQQIVGPHPRGAPGRPAAR